MKKFLIILTVVLTNVFSVVAAPTNDFKINHEAIVRLIDSNNSKFKNFNDSIMMYDNMNFTPIYRFLQLKDNQYEEFYRIHKDVTYSLDYLKKKKENGVKTFNNHISVDLKNCHYILDKEQYHKYLRVLNVTLVNRNLSKYLQ